MRIGREPESNDLVLKDSLVSRRHCRIERRAAGWVVIDLESRFGTYLRSERIAGEREIAFGETIRVGNTPIRFEAGPTRAPSAEVTRAKLPAAEAIETARALAQELAASGENRAIVASLTHHLDVVQRNLEATEERRALAQTLAEIGRLFNLVHDPDTALRLALELAVQAVRASRGAVLVKEETGLVQRATKGMGGTTVAPDVSNEVVTTGKAVTRGDDLEAFTCVPLLDKKLKAIGCAYLAGRTGVVSLGEPQLEFVASFAGQAALCVENAALAAQSDAERKKRERLSRYFSEAVVDDIMLGKETEQLGGESRIVTLLFTDIRGFTSIVEQLSPPEAVEMLNDYFTEIVDELLAEEGTLDKFTGDGIMAFWNAPREHPDHAVRAVRAALRMQARIPALVARWLTEGRSFAAKVGALATRRSGLGRA